MTFIYDLREKSNDFNLMLKFLMLKFVKWFTWGKIVVPAWGKMVFMFWQEQHDEAVV